MHTSSPGSAGEVFRVALRLGLMSFGGPIAHIASFRREYVERRRWLDEATFAELVALCQALPGPASTQLGMAIGMTRAGLAGAGAAWVGFTSPSAAFMIGFALLAMPLDLRAAGWMHGLQLAAVAVVAHAVWSMARTLTPDLPRRLLAVAAAIVALLWLSPVTQLSVIGLGGLVGWLVLPRDVLRARDGTPQAVSRSTSRTTAVVALGTFIGLLVALPLLRLLDGQASAVLDTTYRTGALVFGGGHVVLPLLHQGFVGPGWVADDAFLAGYGAAQALPGPLFTFAGYLGAASSVGPNGVVGGLLAVAGIFLPGALLIIGVLPFWDGMRSAAGARRALAGVNAAVVGLLLAALVTPVATSALRSPVDVVLAVGALAALASGRVPVPAIVVTLAFAGHLASVAA